jgi:hypothetical protein
MLVKTIAPCPVLLTNMEDIRLASSLDLDAQMMMMYVCYANSLLFAHPPLCHPVLLSSMKHRYLDVLD